MRLHALSVSFCRLFRMMTSFMFVRCVRPRSESTMCNVEVLQLLPLWRVLLLIWLSQTTPPTTLATCQSHSVTLWAPMSSSPLWSPSASVSVSMTPRQYVLWRLSQPDQWSGNFLITQEYLSQLIISNYPKFDFHKHKNVSINYKWQPSFEAVSEAALRAMLLLLTTAEPAAVNAGSASCT